MNAVFPANPKARMDKSAGALYAIAGEGGFFYYGQLAGDGTIGCFRFRTTELAQPADVLGQAVMFRVWLVDGSATQALREGEWRKLGRHAVHRSLLEPFHTVQWPVGELTVTVWHQGDQLYDARVEDPRIQDLEIMGVWAVHHIRERLVTDYGAEPGAWHVGGPIWRERVLKEEWARRCPDDPWHQLPEDWVPARQ